MCFKPDKFSVPVLQGFPLYEWNENHPFTMYTILDYLPWYYRSLPKKCVLNQTNLGFPFYRGFPCINEIKPSFYNVYYLTIYPGIIFLYLKSVFFRVWSFFCFFVKITKKASYWLFWPFIYRKDTFNPRQMPFRVDLSPHYFNWSIWVFTLRRRFSRYLLVIC